MALRTYLILVASTVVIFAAAEARRLPHFKDLKYAYPGSSKYGGLYSKQGLLDVIGAPNMTDNINDTCPLRISTMLNLVRYHLITTVPTGVEENQYYTKTFKGDKDDSVFNMYFMLDNDALAKHLKQIYGVPLESTKPAAFIGRKGIMLMNITSSTSGDSCSALLWDGYGFHQATGYLAHTNLSNVYFWQTPDESCAINVKSAESMCFPSKSTVELDTGEEVAMKDLRTGQFVKTLDNKGAVKYTQVVTFLDKSSTHKGPYYTILTESGKQITMKAAHLIFKFETDVTSKRLFTRRAVYASSIQLGDHIYTQAFGNARNCADRVVGVALGYDVGAYAPVTSEGTLLVNGVLVSCFADLADHDLAHSLMTPLRAFYELAPRSLGAGGHYIHKYLKAILRPIGVKILGEDKFFKEPFHRENIF